MEDRNLLYYLRWVAVPFASIIGPIISLIIVVLFSRINDLGFYYSLYNGVDVYGVTGVIMLLCNGYFSGYSFVWAGVYTAPSKKGIVSIVLATLKIFLSCMIILYGLFKGGVIWHEYIEQFLMIAGALHACIYYYKEYGQ